MRAVLTILLASMLLVSCAGMQRQSTGQWLAGNTIGQDHSVMLMRIPDAIEAGEGPAGGSGTGLMTVFRDELMQKGIKIGITEETAITGATAAAKTKRISYVLKVAFTHWEENATEWSGKPDVAAASAELYDAATGDLVAVASHSVTGSTSAMLARTPDRFYPEIADNILGRLFGWTATVRAQK
jgi:hypothetical protein